MNTIKVSFQEGKTRVLDRVNNMYCDITHDYIFQLKNMDVKTEMEDINFTASHLMEVISEYKKLTSDIRNCQSFYELINLSDKYPIFEIIVGAFLGINIDIIS